MTGIPEYGTGRHEDWLTAQDEQRAASDPVPGNAEVAYEQWIGRHDPVSIGGRAGFEAGWLAAVAAAGGWPLCPNGCGCRLGTEDADARDCACDGLCCYDEAEVSGVFAERDRLRGQVKAVREFVGRCATSGRPGKAWLADMILDLLDSGQGTGGDLDGTADPHRDLDTGENGGAMTDGDFYDATAGAPDAWDDRDDADRRASGEHDSDPGDDL